MKFFDLDDPAVLALGAAVGLSGMVMAELEIVKSLCGVGFCLCTFLAVKSFNKSK